MIKIRKYNASSNVPVLLLLFLYWDQCCHSFVFFYESLEDSILTLAINLGGLSFIMDNIAMYQPINRACYTDQYLSFSSVGRHSVFKVFFIWPYVGYLSGVFIAFHAARQILWVYFCVCQYLYFLNFQYQKSTIHFLLYQDGQVFWWSYLFGDFF